MNKVKILVSLSLLATLSSALAAEPSAAQPTPKQSAQVAADSAFKTQAPLGEPTMSDIALPVEAQAYAEAVYTYSYSYLNYKERMLKLQSDIFTQQGGRNFSKAFEQSDVPALIIAKKLTVSAEATGDPVILKKGTLKTGEYAWQVQVSLLVHFKGRHYQETRRDKVIMLIKKTPAGDRVDSIIATVENTAGSKK